MGEEMQLTPTTMVAGGTTLARDETGRVVFVEGALPGEAVRVHLVESRGDYARGIAIEVLEAAPERVLPPCPAVAAGCGGCSWQHIAPEAQLRFKVGIVVDSLRRIGRFAEPPVPVVVPIDGVAHRTTARLAVAPNGRAGHRRRRAPDDAVATDSCLAAHPDLEELITAGRYPGATEVLLRAGVASGERLVKTTPAGVSSAVEVPPGVVVVDGDGEASVHEEVAGRRFRVSVQSFFQPGPVAATALVRAVIDAIGDGLPPGGHLVDAYAGVGMFASIIGATTGAQVAAIECDRSAVGDARINLGDVDGRVVACDVGRWRPRRGDRRVDVMVADPPRPGLGRPGVGAVLAGRAPRVVLVSCDPASFARDAALLREADYDLASIAMVDAFPHTFHLETVSRFDKSR